MKQTLTILLLALMITGCVGKDGESIMRPVHYELNPVNSNR